MNSRYFELPLDKQKNLINSGYKVFALHPYKKASMASIADEANISKSLIFYYFKNKKEYYLFLFDNAIEFLNQQSAESICKKGHDLFELINQSIELKMNLILDYPYLYKFVTKAYYETFEDIKLELNKKKTLITQLGKDEILNLIAYDGFSNPSDAPVLVDMILCIAEGCMRGIEDLDVSKIQNIIPEFKHMMDSLKSHYYKNKDLIGQDEE